MAIIYQHLLHAKHILGSLDTAFNLINLNPKE